MNVNSRVTNELVKKLIKETKNKRIEWTFSKTGNYNHFEFILKADEKYQISIIVTLEKTPPLSNWIDVKVYNLIDKTDKEYMCDVENLLVSDLVDTISNKSNVGLMKIFEDYLNDEPQEPVMCFACFYYRQQEEPNIYQEVQKVAFYCFAYYKFIFEPDCLRICDKYQLLCKDKKVYKSKMAQTFINMDRVKKIIKRSLK